MTHSSQWKIKVNILHKLPSDSLKLQHTEITEIKDEDIRIFFKDFSISEGLSSKEMINFSDTDEHQDAA